MAAWYAAARRRRGWRRSRRRPWSWRGELDVVIPPANSAALAAALAGARLETFPGAGHAFIAQEAPRRRRR